MFGFLRAKALRTLEERVEKLEREVKTASLDWDDLYEKTRRLQGRTAKRDGVARAAAEEADGRPPGVDAKSWEIIQRRTRRVGPTARGG